MKTFRQFMTERLMYGKPAMLPKVNKPETTIKSASPTGHKKFQKRAGRKIGQ